ncbi:hypothetical protein [Cellulomonas sp. JZ18]|uniref:hypothetical protein n=1 Tax=Cellulomonas sp. JZ18 TaxID=2654191 RepID=UPI0018AFA85C|nr:hypothetical protein [Cellulomonas sp. JZ18]
MSALVTAALAAVLVTGAAGPATAPPDGAVDAPASATAAAERRTGGLVDLGVDECATDVNDSGVVVTATHLLHGGRVLPLPGGLTGAQLVNDRGQVAGTVDGQAAFWDGRRTWLIGTLAPDHVLTSLTGLSDRGEVVGTSSALGGEPAAFRWRRGVMTPLAGLGGRTDANDVNDRGQVVGAAWLDGTQHAVRWEPDGRLVRLPGLGDDTGHSLATAVDASGRAAGYSYTGAGTGDMRLVRWSRAGAVTDVSPAPGALGLVSDLNDRGRVVGSVTVPGGPQQSFVADQWGPARLVPADADATTLLTAVNSHGVAVGCTYRGETERAVLWR